MLSNKCCYKPEAWPQSGCREQKMIQTFEFSLIGFHFEMKWPFDKNHIKTKKKHTKEQTTGPQKEIAYLHALGVKAFQSKVL